MCRIGKKDTSFFKYWRSPLECLSCAWHDFFQDCTYLAQLLLRFLRSSFDVFVNSCWFRFWHVWTSRFMVITMPVFMPRAYRFYCSSCRTAGLQARSGATSPITRCYAAFLLKAVPSHAGNAVSHRHAHL